MKLLLELFVTFFKVGLFTFGGGYAMISVIEDACVKKKKWISSDDMLNIIAISESTPGPISVNSATYIGFLKKGVLGSFFATLGLVTPSFFIIYLISNFFEDFINIPWVISLLNGIKVGVAIIVFDAGINMLKKIKKRVFSLIVLYSSFLLIILKDLFSIKISTIHLIIFFGLLSLIYFYINKFFKSNFKKSI